MSMEVDPLPQRVTNRHHGLSDGYHAGLVFDTFQEMLSNPESYVTI